MSNTSGSVVKHNASGITSGSYTFVQVDIFGHVVSGSQINASSPISFSGSTISHNISGVISGSYNKIEVDSLGHVISGSIVSSSGGRELLTGDTIYYIRTDGNDSNTGLENTSGGAFLTIQRGIDKAASIDANDHAITSQVADGTYTGGITFKNIIGSATTGGCILGNITSPSAVIVEVAGDTFLGDSIITPWTISSLKPKSSIGNSISSKNNTIIYFDNIDFGWAKNYHLYADVYSTLKAIGNYSISGSAISHILSAYGANITAMSQEVTITPSLGFTSFARALYSAYVNYSDITFTLGGTVTGTRFVGDVYGVFNTDGSGSATYFPGDTDGTLSNGALYL
jgi:hypothetical protein